MITYHSHFIDGVSTKKLKKKFGIASDMRISKSIYYPNFLIEDNISPLKFNNWDDGLYCRVLLNKLFDYQKDILGVLTSTNCANINDFNINRVYYVRTIGFRDIYKNTVYSINKEIFLAKYKTKVARWRIRFSDFLPNGIQYCGHIKTNDFLFGFPYVYNSKTKQFELTNFNLC